jgi:Fe-S cluster biosynthesis and repair protein YggX
MTRTVQCQMLNEELEGLIYQTWPGEIGKRIFDNISQKAWAQWMSHQTMLINENRLSPLDPEHRKLIETEMEQFLFGGGVEKPAGYVAPED